MAGCVYNCMGAVKEKLGSRMAPRQLAGWRCRLIYNTREGGAGVGVS